MNKNNNDNFVFIYTFLIRIQSYVMLKVTTHRSVETWAFALRNETNDRALSVSVYLQSRLSLDKKIMINQEIVGD